MSVAQFTSTPKIFFVFLFLSVISFILLHGVIPPSVLSCLLTGCKLFRAGTIVLLAI